MARFGKYDLVRKLATGGMAEVYLARFEWALGLEKTVVVKRILPHLAEDPSFCDMFFSEAKLAAQLNHPGIAQIIEFGEHAGTYFLSMEYVDGPSLRQLEHSAALRDETIPFSHSARIAAACCEALAYAHDLVDAHTGQPLELVHRDVSPDNILISRTGAVKLVDFGIAKAATQSHRTETGGVKGKLGYMSPEQLRARPLDRRTDVYALGVVLYEMLAGARPYEAPTEASLITAILTEEMVPLRARSPDVPEPLDRIVRRALQRRAEDRYPDCRAMHADLEAAIRASPQPATVFQIAQLAAQDSETERTASPRALATPERPYPTARTPLPWRADGTDAKGRAVQVAAFGEDLALTGTEDTYKRPAPPPEPLSGPLALLAPADTAEGKPTLRRASSTDPTRPFVTGRADAPAVTQPGAGGTASTRPFATAPAARATAARRGRWLAILIAVACTAVLASVVALVIARDTPSGPIPLPPPRTPPPPAETSQEAAAPLPPAHDAKGARDTGEAAGTRDTREMVGTRDTREAAGTRDPRELVGARDAREAGTRDTREVVGARDTHDANGAIDARDANGARDTREVVGAHDTRDANGARDAREVVGARGAADTREVRAVHDVADTPEAPAEPPSLRPRASQRPSPSTVELVVSSDPPSQLRILSGRKVISEGRSPIAARVPPGPVTVEASAAGAKPWFKQETLTLGAAPRQVSHTITIEQGSVLVRTFPASHVTVDGVPRGDVPLKLTLFQGPHLLRLECDPSVPRCADQPAFTTTVTVEPGKSLEVMHKW